MTNREFYTAISNGEMNDELMAKAAELLEKMNETNAKRAQKILEKAGYLCHADSVYAAVISDEVGSLNALLKTVADAGINIDYIYMSHDRESGEMIAVFHSQDIEGVEEALTWRGYRML